jgi:hypothetical protein
MALARADSYCRLLAFWLVGYGERLWRLVGEFVVEFVVGWHCGLVCSSKEEWNNSPP